MSSTMCSPGRAKGNRTHEQHPLMKGNIITARHHHLLLLQRRNRQHNAGTDGQPGHAINVVLFATKLATQTGN